MAHSFIFTKNLDIERSVAVPESVLELFMFFFIEVSKPQVKPNTKESTICEHYKIELFLEAYIGFMDAMLQEVSEYPQLKSWYLSMLSQLALRLDDFGGYIDNNYLNQVPELIAGYAPGSNPWSKPVEISLIKNLINDIYWVLNEQEYTPSGQFKWFEENI